MRILERKGAKDTSRTTKQTGFLYRPLLGRLIASERPSNEELARLKALIERYEDGASWFSPRRSSSNTRAQDSTYEPVPASGIALIVDSVDD